MDNSVYSAFTYTQRKSGSSLKLFFLEHLTGSDTNPNIFTFDFGFHSVGMFTTQSQDSDKFVSNVATFVSIASKWS